jgi:hypothetical protein
MHVAMTSKIKCFQVFAVSRGRKQVTYKKAIISHARDGKAFVCIYSVNKHIDYRMTYSASVT